jgi:tetratricopeptide (TPR) repeat protein
MTRLGRGIFYILSLILPAACMLPAAAQVQLTRNPDEAAWEEQMRAALHAIDDEKDELAEAKFKAALEIAEKAKLQTQSANTLQSLALLYYREKKLDASLESAKKALAIRESYLKPDDPLIATSANNLASVYAAMEQYTEAEVNEKIKLWLADNNYFPNWDYMMLRRRLVDDCFLTRNRDGSFYWINPSGPVEVVFDPTITGLNINEVLSEGKKLIAQRKAAYQNSN